MTSSRLLGKVMKELPYGSSVTVLEQVIRRLKQSNSLQEIVVATTTNKDDDSIVAITRKEGVAWFRGSEKDVLSRYYYAAEEHSIDIIVRITSDCPCIDPQVVDSVVDSQIKTGVDYTSNSLTRTFPHGLDVEAFTFDALAISFSEGKEDFEREHVTPFIYRAGRFKVYNMEAPESLRRPDIRITLDTQEDYALLCAVYDYLYASDPFFGVEAIIALFQAKPWLTMINERMIQKKIFNSLEEELIEAEKILDIQDLKRARDYVHNLREAGQ